MVPSYGQFITPSAIADIEKVSVSHLEVSNTPPQPARVLNRRLVFEGVPDMLNHHLSMQVGHPYQFRYRSMAIARRRPPPQLRSRVRAHSRMRKKMTVPHFKNFENTFRPMLFSIFFRKFEILGSFEEATISRNLRA